MENASEAIKMAAAVLVFMLALSLAIVMFSRARAASVSVMDKGGVQSFYNSEKLNNYKIVGIDTVIPTLYSYFQENVTILFYQAKIEGGVLSDLKPLPLYYTETLKEDLKNSRLDAKSVNNSYDQRAIYGLDNNDEMTRREPWTGSDALNEDFVSDLIAGRKENGTKYFSTAYKLHLGGNIYGTDDDSNEPYFQIDFQHNNCLNYFLNQKLHVDSLSKATNARFVERVGSYNYDAYYSNPTNKDGTINEDELLYSKTNTTKSLIEFDNDEAIENREGNIKRIIQFIYVGKSEELDL